MRWFGMHACPEVILAMILVPWIMQRMMITGRKICMVPSKFTLNLLGCLQTTVDPTTAIFGLCTRKLGILVLVGDPLESH